AHVVEQQVGIGGELAPVERLSGTGPGAERGEVAARTADLREEVTATTAVAAQLGGRWRREEAHEVVRHIELFLVDLGIGSRIDPGRDGLAPNVLLRGLRRVRDAHLRDKRAGIELRQ